MIGRIAPAIVAGLLLAGCAPMAGRREVAASPAPPPAAVAASDMPKAYQWLGSGEAAGLSRQAYGMLARYVVAAAHAPLADSAILAEGATPDAPRWVPCGDKPKAIVLDMDETAILNTGANYDAARRGDPPFDPQRWEQWERESPAFVDPVPGSVEALAAVRAAGVTPIFISNRKARLSAQAAEALDRAGLGSAEPGKTMFLAEDDGGSGKDTRRALVARQWCVIAMAGDQLGDFSDLFNARGLAPADRRRLAQSPAIAGRWGQSWFLMPNPAYGPGDAGTLDQVFPDHRWPGPKETN